MVLTVGFIATLKNTSHLPVYAGLLLLAQNGKSFQSA